MKAIKLILAGMTILATAIAFTTRFSTAPGQPGYALLVAIVLMWLACIVWAIAEFFRVGTGSAGCLLLSFLGTSMIFVAPLALIYLAFQPSKRVCPTCGATLRGGAATCPYCDGEVEESAGQGQ